MKTRRTAGLTAFAWALLGMFALAFADDDPLAKWTIEGDVSVDMTKHREDTGDSLKIGPGSKATLELAETDLSGKVEFWVYDDMTCPKRLKENHVGPRWGVAQGDGRVLAVGALYASYLGGDKGYTATASDGTSWFEKLFWLGGRSRAGWSKWTFDFDPEKGLKVFKDGKPVRVDAAEVGMNGFSSSCSTATLVERKTPRRSG